MSTKFMGHKTGFNPKGNNDCAPNAMGPPTTKFGGRPAVPAGPLKRYPGAVADIGNSNRKNAASMHGDGGGSGTRFVGRTAFNGDNPAGSGGKVSKTYDTKDGNGVRKGRKT